MNHQVTNLEDLARRLAKIEVQNRRWKVATSVLGLLTVSLVLVAAKPAERLEPVVQARTVEAEEFLLKDENGHVFARLGLNADKRHKNQPALGKTSPAVLDFYDEDGDLASTVPVTGGFLPVR